MTIDYAAAGDLLASYGRAWTTFDGDLLVSLFTADAEYHEDPFEPPMIGHNAIRAYWLEAAASQEQVEFDVERHWVSGDTVLAAWHAVYVRRGSSDRVRLAGFFVLDVAGGKIRQLREWWHRRPAQSGGPDQGRRHDGR